MKQYFGMSQTGNLKEAAQGVHAPGLLILMSNADQFEAHVTELESLFPGVPSIGCIGMSYSTRVVEKGVGLVAFYDNVTAVANQEQQAHAPAVRLGQNPIKLLATGLIEPLEGAFDQQARSPPGEVGQQAKFASLAGTELTVASVEQIAQGKIVDQRSVRLDIGEKGAGGRARIDPVKKVGLVPTQFLLVEGLLLPERYDTGIGRPSQLCRPGSGFYAAEKIAEPIHAGTGVANTAPGLASPGLESADA